MKILMMGQESPWLSMGGLGIYMKETCKELVKRGHEVTWLGVDPKWLQGLDSTHPDGYRVILADNCLQRFPNETLYHQISIDQVFTMALLERLKNEQFDIIHINDSYLWEIARRAKALFNCPIVAGLHLSFGITNPLPSDNDRIYKEIWLYERQQEANFLIGSDALFTVSNKYADLIRNEYMLEREITVINNGVNLEPIKNAKKYWAKKPIIGFVGRLSSSKGIELVIDLVKYRNDLNFTIIAAKAPGIENTHPLVELLTKTQDDYENIVWFDNMWEGEKWDFMKSCSVGLVPTLMEEPFGIVGLEWMAAKVPVVSTITGGMKDYMYNLNSVVADPTVESFSDGIDKALKNSQSITRYGLNTAKKFTWQKSVDKLEGIYENVTIT